MSSEGRGEAGQNGVARAIALLSGPYWYVIPCLIVIALGFGTCSLVDEPDPDTFEVERSVPDRSGVRHAVILRQRHLDSGNTVACVVIVAGPAPSAGPTRRLAGDCAMIAPDVGTRISLSWQPNGRLKAVLPPGSRPVSGEVVDANCYYETGKGRGFVCYNSVQMDVEVEKTPRP